MKSLRPSDCLIGIILIILGLGLTFMGKSLFKPAMGTVGFVGFALLAYIPLVVIDHNYSFGENGDWIKLAVSLVAGLIGFAILYSFTGVALYVIGGLCGFSLAIWLMSMKPGGLIENTAGRSVFIAVAVVIGIVVAFFAKNAILIGGTSIIGSFMFFIGVDVFAKTGMNDQILQFAKAGKAVKFSTLKEEYTNKHGNLTALYVLLSFMVILAVLGALFQIFGTRFLTIRKKSQQKNARRTPV